MKLFLFALATAIFLIVLSSTQTSANEIVVVPESSSYVAGEVLVKFKDNTSESIADSVLQRVGAKEQGGIPQIGVKKLKVPEHAIQRVIEALNRNPNVEFAELNYLAEVEDHIEPNDPHWPAQWGPQKVQAPKAWDLTTGDETVIVAVIDTGVYEAHPDLTSRILPGYDFADDDSDATDDHGHGTQVAGIIAASTNNELGIAGLTWLGSILPVKVCHQSSCTYENLAKGFIYAADEGAKVISTSIGGSEASEVLRQATEYAWEQGAVLVASAGNRSEPSVSYPARFQSVLAVGSSNQNDQLSSFSNYGEDLDLLAPGEWIRTTSMPDGYWDARGTSFSAPHVAAAAALLWSAGALSNSEVVEAILSGADDLGIAGRDDIYGNGRLNINNSLLDLNGDSTPTPTIVLTPTPTITPTATPTPTIVPTPTPTIEPTNTPDPTPTETITPKPTKPPKKTPKGWGRGGKPR